MASLSPTLIVSVLASLCVGGAVGAGVTRVTLETPACTTPAMAPKAAKAWQQFKNVPPLDDTGKTY
jgi:hypothetical protein